MMRRDWILGFVLVACACSGPSAKEPAKTPPAADEPVSAAASLEAQARSRRHHALLIGVSAYDHLPRRQLSGPPNDVELMKRTLQQFGVPAESIRTLAEGTHQGRPTRANIASEFQRLAKAAGPGDQVTIFMAGHGSQQPSVNLQDEPDGWDETFLPADTKGWNGAAGVVENAIVDNEIRDWLTAIRNRGAFVWIIFDSCHSGTMTRGAPQEVERERQIRVEELVPPEVVQQVRDRVARSGTVERGGRAAPADTVLGLARDTGDLVALYASQPSETTPERLAPGGNTVYGLFTHTLNSVLQERSTPLTYAELAERVADRYRSEPRMSPNPSYEGGAANREVLGLKVWPDRPRIQIGASKGNELEVLAGSVHGLRTGSILAVYPPAGAADAQRVRGHLKLARVNAVTSVATPTAYGGIAAPAADSLPSGSRAEVVLVDLGDLQLKVAAQIVEPGRSAEGEPIIRTVATGRGPAALERALASLVKVTNGLVSRVDSAAGATWFVRVRGQQVELVPAEGWSLGSGRSVSGGAAATTAFEGGTLTDEAALSSTLANSLRTIAKARHLIGLAGAGGSVAPPLVQMSIDVLTREGNWTRPEDCPQSSSGASRLVYTEGGRVIRAGTCVWFVVKNESQGAADLAVLFVDSHYGIQMLFPMAVADNPIRSQQELRLGPFLVNATTTGLEHIVGIAVKSGVTPTNFSILAQDSLSPAQAAAIASRGGPGGESADLIDLLAKAMHGEGMNVSAGAHSGGPTRPTELTRRRWSVRDHDAMQSAGTRQALCRGTGMRRLHRACGEAQ
jgi:hypothetical protein